MSEPSFRFQQFVLFGIIISEMVVTPSILAGIAYYFTREKPYQVTLTVVAFILGLLVAFYRISLMQKKLKKDANAKIK